MCVCVCGGGWGCGVATSPGCPSCSSSTTPAAVQHLGRQCLHSLQEHTPLPGPTSTFRISTSSHSASMSWSPMSAGRSTSYSSVHSGSSSGASAAGEEAETGKKCSKSWCSSWQICSRGGASSRQRLDDNCELLGGLQGTSCSSAGTTATWATSKAAGSVGGLEVHPSAQATRRQVKAWALKKAASRQRLRRATCSKSSKKHNN